MDRRELIIGSGIALGAAGMLATPASAKTRAPVNRVARAAIAGARRSVNSLVQDYNRSLTNLRRQSTTIDLDSFVRSLGLTGTSLGKSVVERVAQAVQEVLQALQDSGQVGAPGDDLTRALNQLVEIVLCAQEGASNALRQFQGLQVQGQTLHPGIAFNSSCPFGTVIDRTFNTPRARIDVVSSVNNLANLGGGAPPGAPVNVSAFSDQGDAEQLFTTANGQAVWFMEGITLTNATLLRPNSNWNIVVDSPAAPFSDSLMIGLRKAFLGG